MITIEEDFTTYTEVDPTSTITVDSATQISVASGINSYIYKDKGVDFFGGDFQFSVDFNTSGGVNEQCTAGFWMLSNNIGTVAEHDANNWPYLLVRFRRSVSYYRDIIEHDGTSVYETNYQMDTRPGYYTIIRDEAIGGFGRLTLKEYSDEARTTLVDTLYLDLHVKTDFRYLYAAVQVWSVGEIVSNLGWEGQSDLIVTLPVIEPILLGGGLLTPNIPVVEALLSGPGRLESSLPLIIPLAEGSDDINHGNIHLITLPSISASITEGTPSTLVVTIPMITATMSEALISGNVSVTLPIITAEMIGGVGGFLEVGIPLITADIVSGALCEVSIPVVTSTLVGVVGEIAKLNQSLPVITVSVTGKVEILGNIDTSLPMLQAYTAGLTGKLIAGAFILPVVQADISGYNDLTSNIDSTLATIMAYAVGTPTRFAACSYILRYADLPDCLGNINTDIPIITVSIKD